MLESVRKYFGPITRLKDGAICKIWRIEVSLETETVFWIKDPIDRIFRATESDMIELFGEKIIDLLT